MLFSAPDARVQRALDATPPQPATTTVQGYLAHKKQDPTVGLYLGGAFLMSEVST